MNNQNLKDAVAAVIKANGNEEITGSILQSSLLAIINHFGSGSVFGGIAVPNTQPIDSDVNSFYFATVNGTYANFGGYVIDKNQFTVFTNKSGSWVALPDLNVKSIFKIEKTGTSGYVDTYTITFSDGSTFTYSVTNGKTVDSWHAGNYPANTFVFYDSGLYEATTDVTASDVPGVSDKWVLKMMGFTIQAGDHLLSFSTADGSELFHVDKNGNLWAMYDNNSIPQAAIQNLSYDIQELYKGVFRELQLLDIFQIVTPDNSISVSQDKDGTIYIPRLRIDELDYNALKPTVNKNVFTGTFYDMPDTSQVKLNFTIIFPVDIGVVQRGTVDFMIGDNILMTANCEISVQGNYSASNLVPKKGYTVDLFNADWKKLKIKIGKLPALYSYHLKAYWTDANRCKDLFNFRLWKQLILNSPYPENMFKTLNPAIGLSQEQAVNSAEAPFMLDGFPTVVYNQGSFMGCYVLRMKKHATVFALDTKNQNHIHLDSQMYNCALGAKPYANYEEIAIDYEVRSPKSPNTTAKANVYRFFRYMIDVYNNVKSFSGTYQDYLVLNRWIDFFLICELIGHWDSIINNAMYITYDGTHWMPVLIDTDFTLGVAESPFGKLAVAPTGANSFYIGNKDIFPKFRAQLLPEIKARYAAIRNTTLSMENMTALLNSVISSWGRSDAEADIRKWGVVTLPEAIETTDNIIKFLQDRKTLFLDVKYL